MKSKLIIYGNGATAKILYSYMKETYHIEGFCVDKNWIKENSFQNLPLVPFEEVENHFSPTEYKMINSIGFVQMNKLRKERCEQAEKKGYELVSYVDNSVKIHDGVKIGKNCIILDFVSIHPQTEIGDGTFISSNVNIGHDCKIGPYNWINAGVSIAGFVSVGEECFWGVNSSAGNNISIGKRNYISANTLVCKNTEDDGVYISPAGEKFRLKSTNFLKFIGA